MATPHRKKINLAAGISMSYAKASFKEYGNQVQTRSLASIWTAIIFKPINHLKVQADLRQEFVFRPSPPLTPKLGLELELLKNSLTLHGSIGRNYHIPSMNDLFWVPGGNRNLKPEDAISYEAGIRSGDQMKSPLKFDFTFF